MAVRAQRTAEKESQNAKEQTAIAVHQQIEAQNVRKEALRQKELAETFSAEALKLK